MGTDPRYLNDDLGGSGFLNVVQKHILPRFPSAFVQPYAEELGGIFIEQANDATKGEMAELYNAFINKPADEKDIHEFYQQAYALTVKNLEDSKERVDLLLMKTKYGIYLNAESAFRETIGDTLREIQQSISDGTLADEVRRRHPDWLGFQKGMFVEDGARVIELADATDLSEGTINSGAVGARRLNMLNLRGSVEDMLVVLKSVQSLAIPSTAESFGAPPVGGRPQMALRVFAAA